MPNFYEILKLDNAACPRVTRSVIEHAYKRLSAQNHLQQDADKRSIAQRELDEAYFTLSDDEKRKKYDQKLAIEKLEKILEGFQKFVTEETKIKALPYVDYTSQSILDACGGKTLAKLYILYVATEKSPDGMQHSNIDVAVRRNAQAEQRFTAYLELYKYLQTFSDVKEDAFLKLSRLMFNVDLVSDEIEDILNSLIKKSEDIPSEKVYLLLCDLTWNLTPEAIDRLLTPRSRIFSYNNPAWQHYFKYVKNRYERALLNPQSHVTPIDFFESDPALSYLRRISITSAYQLVLFYSSITSAQQMPLSLENGENLINEALKSNCEHIRIYAYNFYVIYKEYEKAFKHLGAINLAAESIQRLNLKILPDIINNNTAWNDSQKIQFYTRLIKVLNNSFSFTRRGEMRSNEDLQSIYQSCLHLCIEKIKSRALKEGIHSLSSNETELCTQIIKNPYSLVIEPQTKLECEYILACISQDVSSIRMKIMTSQDNAIVTSLLQLVEETIAHTAQDNKKVVLQTSPITKLLDQEVERYSVEIDAHVVKNNKDEVEQHKTREKISSLVSALKVFYNKSTIKPLLEESQLNAVERKSTSSDKAVKRYHHYTQLRHTFDKLYVAQKGHQSLKMLDMPQDAFYRTAMKEHGFLWQWALRITDFVTKQPGITGFTNTENQELNKNPWLQKYIVEHHNDFFVACDQTGSELQAGQLLQAVSK